MYTPKKERYKISGGYFDYNQFQFHQAADDLEDYIEKHKKEPEFSEKTLEKFSKGLEIIRQAAIYLNRIDYLLSGDDGEDSFHRRLNKELEENRARHFDYSDLYISPEAMQQIKDWSKDE